MTSSELLVRLHRHRMWSNRRILESTDSLTEHQLHELFAIGQGTVWKTLTHLQAAEYVWLEALLGNDSPVFPGDLPNQLPGNQKDVNPISSLSELKRRWNELDQRWNDYLNCLTDDSLDDLVYKISTSSGQGKRFATRRSDVLLHICIHAQYTTAQLINMLRHLNCSKLPDVMLITMAREEIPHQPDAT
ncbi:DinB family protein [Thalassoglobus sp. JC818]|uniref:DinB family protein n=1 Tax=Thalassoglobus sp. JC818 TaxID=3232136 RepID=UPI003458E28C